MPYVQGFLLAVPEANKDAYVKMARDAWALFERHGALSTWECWEEDVPDGAHTSFPMAVKREPGEKVVFSWVLWRDRAACDAAAKAMGEEFGDAPGEMPFDGKRMMWGGFTPVFTAGTG